MKVLFLDVDGVLNWSGTGERLGGFIGLCDARIARLNRIFEAVPETKIVVSSTWRDSRILGVYEGFEGFKELLRSRGVTQEVVGKTKSFFSYMNRGSEIREYVNTFEARHPGEKLEAFVILDDATEGMAGYSRTPFNGMDPGDPSLKGVDLRPQHVVSSWDGWNTETNVAEPEGGLLDRHVDRAVSVLRGGRVPVGIRRYDEDNDNWVTVNAVTDEELAKEEP